MPSKGLVAAAIGRHRHDRTRLIDILRDVQAQAGFIISRSRLRNRRRTRRFHGRSRRRGHVLSFLYAPPRGDVRRLSQRQHRIGHERPGGGGRGLRKSRRLPVRGNHPGRPDRPPSDLLHRDERPGALGPHQRRGFHQPDPGQGPGHRRRDEGRDGRGRHGRRPSATGPTPRSSSGPWSKTTSGRKARSSSPRSARERR